MTKKLKFNAPFKGPPIEVVDDEESLEARLRQGCSMLTDKSLRAFGKGKFDAERGVLISDDNTWLLGYDPETKGVYIGDTVRTTRPEINSFTGSVRQSKQLPSVDVEIIDWGTNHKLVKIYKRGRVYATTYAEPFPTKESALNDYYENPKLFAPFDEATGRYLG
jgi:hypothetical protein